MPIIRSISDLRNRAKKISQVVHQEDEPVFITRNGEGDMVVMSLSHYEQLQALLSLYQKLGEAEEEATQGKRGISHAQMMKKLQKQLG